MSAETIRYYNEHAAEYAAATGHADMSACRERFLRYLPCCSRILDAGCGSGRDALAFKNAGYEVEAFDASEELCRFAAEHAGVPVYCCRFEELGEPWALVYPVNMSQSENLGLTQSYDGIWACASLLHVRRTDLPDVLCTLHSMLRPGGVLYASFKLGRQADGDGESDGISLDRVSADGRYFCDMTEESCREVMEAAGFTVKELFLTHDVRPDRQDGKWVNVIGSK